MRVPPTTVTIITLVDTTETLIADDLFDLIVFTSEVLDFVPVGVPYTGSAIEIQRVRQSRDPTLGPGKRASSAYRIRGGLVQEF